MDAKDTRRARRGRGEGSIYQAADGRWRGAVAYTDDVGRLQRRWVSGRTRAEVIDRLRAKRERIDAERRLPTTTLAAYADIWLDGLAGHVEPPTIRDRRGHLANHLLPALGHLRLADLRARHVQTLLDDLAARGLASKSIQRIRSTLSVLLRAAVLDELVPVNVVSAVRTPKTGMPREHVVLTPTQVRTIVMDTADDPLHALWVLDVTIGARIGELLALDWSDVDVSGRRLSITRSIVDGPGARVKDTKTPASRRVIDLPAVACEALEAHRLAAGRAIGAIFRGPDGTRLARHIARAGWHAMLLRLGLPAMRFHDGRHTAASLLLAAGQPVTVVSRMLGHSTPRVTLAVYAHAIPGTGRQAADAMDALLVG